MSETVHLAGRLDLPAARPLHAQLAPLIGKKITLDMTSVCQIGALCLQTLIAASRANQTNGAHFQLTNTSEQVLGQLNAMGSTPEQISRGHL